MNPAIQKLLLVYSTLLSTVLGMVLLGGATPSRTGRFDTLSAQRINIVEPDGTLRLIMAGHKRFPGLIVKGRETPMDRPQAGMLFYNDEGSEVGGLIFAGHKNAKGEVEDCCGSLSFDRYGANQFVQLAGVWDKTDQFAGLAISGEASRRIWVGNMADGAARVALMDNKGLNRLILEVTQEGAASISFLDENGAVVSKLQPSVK